MRDGVNLIAYADRLGGDLEGLRLLLDGRLSGLFTGVHVLPFFLPYDGADAGFDPTDHLRVDPRLGAWSDLAAIARTHDVMADAIVNHVSSRSPQFRDVVDRGSDSPHVGMFLTYDGVFPDGATEDELLRIYRPRPGLPFTPMALADRSRHLFWTTFTASQIDLDVSDPATVDYLRSVLGRLAAGGVTTVRLDAVGYAVKIRGTSCFMTSETVAFIDRLSGWAHDLGMEVLVEVHSHYERQLAIADRVDRVYDFALPPLVLHGLFTGDAAPLKSWLRRRPTNAVTVLDTHDGIGVVDVGPGGSDGDAPGLLDAAQVDRLVTAIHEHTAGQSRQATGAAAANVDLYQVNSTFYDAVGRDDDRYLAARLVQLFTPGVPQVYYVGLLAGTNDMELLARTGVGRDINRHHYTPDEITAALATPVVRRLCALIRFRNAHPAFAGSWELLDTPHGSVGMRWTAGDDVAEAWIDLRGATSTVRYTWAGHAGEVTDLLDLPGSVLAPGAVTAEDRDVEPGEVE